MIFEIFSLIFVTKVIESLRTRSGSSSGPWSSLWSRLLGWVRESMRSLSDSYYILGVVVRQRQHQGMIPRIDIHYRLRIWVRFQFQRRLRELLHHATPWHQRGRPWHLRIFRRGRHQRPPRRGIAKPIASNNQTLLFLNPRIVTEKSTTNQKPLWKNGHKKLSRFQNRKWQNDGSQKKSQWMSQPKNLSHPLSQFHWRATFHPRKNLHGK